jgi:hypothetical protein
MIVSLLVIKQTIIVTAAIINIDSGMAAGHNLN